MNLRPAISRWLPSYERSWLRVDALAGLTVAAVLIPSALSYAVIVGVEPIVGLYTVPFALVAYAVFGGSRLLVVGPDAALSVLAAATIATVSTGGDEIQVMTALSLVTGGLFVLFSLLRMGWIADLVPDSVLKGFIQGLVWVTILGQVPALLGLSLDEDFPDFWRQAGEIVEELGTSNGATALLGVGCLVVLIALTRMLPSLPGPLVVLIGSLVVVGLGSLADEGVAVVGEPSGGSFGFGLPTGLTAAQWIELVPGALAIVVVGFTESMGAASTAAQRTGERLDPNEELFALGTSNVAAGVSGGYVVTGALSKTAVAISSGGRSQVGNVVAAIAAVVSTVVFRPLFEQLASAVLAALVVFAMAGMVDAAALRRLWNVRKREFLLAAVTFVGVLTFGVLTGVVIGVVMSLAVLVEHIGRPAGIVLGVAPDGRWRDVDVVEGAKQIDGLVIFRQEAPIVYLNARRLADELRELITDETRVVIIDASAVSAIDSTGYEKMRALRREYDDRAVEFWTVNPSLRKRRSVEEDVAVLDIAIPRRFESIDDAVAEYRERPAAAE